MRTKTYNSETLKILLEEKKIATLPQLKFALGTDVDMTVFRKLQELSYQTSYSHRGQYYTLAEIVEYNERGLWFYDSVCFSQYGNLLETVKFFVTDSDAGYCAHELEAILQVQTKEPLLCLAKRGAIYRKKLSKTYVYFSANPKIRRRQLLFRQNLESKVDSATERTATVLFLSLLDEKQRRLYAGLESLKLGYGGDKKVALYLGLDVRTVAKGKQELIERTYKEEGVRDVGGGRISIKKNARNRNRT